MKYSLYIHIPFCTHRCAYCDFNTYAGREDAIPAYVEALTREIEFAAREAPERIRAHTVFFGGGTPTLLTPAQFKAILSAIRANFNLTDNAEITTEANPGTVSLRGLAELRRLGINRISFGAQSANGEELRMLERTHSFLDVIEAVTNARRAGFDNLNLDLIYGLPEQGLETWQTTVRRVLDLQPEHVSAYALTLEHGTPFGRWTSRGMLPVLDPDAAAEMYEWASQAFERAGLVQYEISNWARQQPAGNDQPASEAAAPGYACQHNLQYWRYLPYLGFGAGAHGYAGGKRYSNVLRIATYIDRLERQNGDHPGAHGGNEAKTEERQSRMGFPLSPATVNQHGQSAEDDMSEFMITGLRLTREGIDEAEFRERFGRELSQVYGSEIEELLKVGLLEWAPQAAADGSKTEQKPGVLRLTQRGRLLGNRVFVRFV